MPGAQFKFQQPLISSNPLVTHNGNNKKRRAHLSHRNDRKWSGELVECSRFVEVEEKLIVDLLAYQTEVRLLMEKRQKRVAQVLDECSISLFLPYSKRSSRTFMTRFCPFCMRGSKFSLICRQSVLLKLHSKYASW